MNNVYNMDCLEGLKNLPDESVDIVITDPPYSTGTRQQTNKAVKKENVKWSGSGLEWDSCFSNFQLEQFLRRVFMECARVLKKSGHIYVFTDWRQNSMFQYVLESSGLFLNNVIVWDKGIYALGTNYRSQYELIIFGSRGMSRRLNNCVTGNVLNCKRVTNSIHSHHPTQKPETLIRKLLETCAKKGDVVLDPFMGGGAVPVACKQKGLGFIGFDVCKKYYDTCIRRLNQAQLINTLPDEDKKIREGELNKFLEK